MTSLAGSIASLLLILFKSKLAVICGGRRYYYICLSALLLFLVPLSINMPPLYSYPSLTQDAVPASLDASPAAAGEKAVTVPSAASGPPQATGAVQAPARTAEAWILGIWGSGAVVMLCFYTVNYIRFKRRALRGIRIDQAGGLHVLASHDVHSPMLIGFHKPQVVFPMKHMSMEDYQLALKHELIHYKQKDAWFKLGAVIVNCLHWFNPVSYLALANIGEACEYAVDETLSKSMKPMEKKRYSEMILRFASQATPAFNSGLAQPKKQLYRRFKLILSRNTGRNQAPLGIAAAVLIVAVALFSTSAVFATSSPTTLTEYSGGIKTYYNINNTLEENVRSTLGKSAMRVVSADLYIDKHGLKLDYFNRTAPYYKVGIQWMDKADAAAAALTQIELTIQNRTVTVAFGEQAAAYKDDSVIRKMIASQMKYELTLDDKKLAYDHAAFVDELIRRGVYVIDEVLTPDQFTFRLIQMQNGDTAGYKPLTTYDEKTKITNVFSGIMKLPKSELDPKADGSGGLQLGKAFVLKSGETLAMDVIETTDHSPTISLAVIDEATERVVYWSPVVTSGTRTIFVPGESSANRSFKIVASGEQKDIAKLNIFTYPSGDEAHTRPSTDLNPGSLDSEPIRFKMR